MLGVIIPRNVDLEMGRGQLEDLPTRYDHQMIVISTQPSPHASLW